MFQKFLDKPVLILVLYVIISLVIYYPTIGAGMIFDFNSWIFHYLTGTYKDVLNSFGYPGLHQIEQFAFFSIYNFFKLNTFAWYFIFALLHGVTAFVVFKFISKWLSVLKKYNFKQIARITSLFFLLSPLAADVVVNKVTIHYLMSNLFIYAALYYLVIYFEKAKLKYIGFTFLFFILALFSLEITYVFPILYLIVWLSLFYFNDRLKWSKQIVLPIFLPFLMLGLFLLLHKFLIGSVIGHYGSEVHTKINLEEIYATVIRYFASYTVLFDYWDYKYKNIVSDSLMNFSFILLPITFLMVGGIGIYSFLKKQKVIFLIFLAFVLTVFSLAPIANLYYSFMFPIENDRYGYLSSAFMYLFIVLILNEIKFKKVRWALLGFFFIVNSTFLVQNIQIFSQSSKLAWGLLNDFRWFDKEVIILEDPDIFEGAKMFSTDSLPTSFSESLLLHTGIDRRENIRSVYQMNFKTLHDSVNVTKITENHYKVEMAQWGNWFFKDMIGASSFENEWCRAEINKSGLNYYDLYLKEVDADVVFIYAAGPKWTEVKH